MLRLEHVSKVFDRGSPTERAAIDDVSFDVNAGEFVVVIGANGAGKSTLLALMAGDFAPDAGRIFLGGRDVTLLSTHRRSRWIGRVFQDPSAGTATGLTVDENLAVADLRGRPRRLGGGVTRERRARYRALLAVFGLGLEARLATRVEFLSGGHRQCLALAMAIAQRPDVLLLDEHCASLDPRTAELVMARTVEIVEECGVTTLMVTHNMHHALRHGRRLLLLDEGRLQLDVSGVDKNSITLNDLVRQFHLSSEALLMGR